jgi:hypothetical protein
MPTTIILRITDDAHAREIMAVGAKDLALGFLPDAKIHVDRVSLCYRSPAEEAVAAAGLLDFKESRDTWANSVI